MALRKEELEDEPPKPRGRPKKQATPRVTVAAKTRAEIEGALAKFFVKAGVMLYMFAKLKNNETLEKDAQAFISGSDRLANALANEAERNPKLKASLSKFVGASTHAELIGAVTAILIPIGNNHGVIPYNEMLFKSFGIEIPEAEESSNGDSATV